MKTRHNFTDANIEKNAPLALRNGVRQQVIYHDKRTPGLRVSCGLHTRTFVYVGNVKQGRQRAAVTLGRVGTMTCVQARAAAAVAAAEMARGIDPRKKESTPAEAVVPLTLGDALAFHVAEMTRRNKTARDR